MEKSGYLPIIFKMQRDLIHKFHEIELNNGAVQTSDLPVDLDSWPGQARLRDFAWRITEELMESVTAYLELQDAMKKKTNLYQMEWVVIPEEIAERNIGLWSKFKEELMDCLHFLVEFSLLSGYDFNGCLEDFDILERLLNPVVTPELPNFQTGILQILIDLSMGVNALRNRAWKQAPRKTDREFFYKQLDKVWVGFGDVLSHFAFTPKAVFQGYCGKNKINQDRQQAGV